MNKNEFLHTLGAKLKEALPVSQIEGHLKYYNDYINQEEQAGKSEQEVIDSLGDPTLLARTILETANQQNTAGAYQGQATEDIYQEDGDTYQKGSTSGSQMPPFLVSATSGWGCLAVAIVAILVIGLVLWLFGIVFKALIPVLVPVLIVLFVVAILKQRH
jgi:Predicted membrane protein